MWVWVLYHCVQSSCLHLTRFLCLQGFVSCLHFTGRRTICLIKVNGHLVQCRPLEHSLEAFYHSHARLKPFVFLVRFVPLLYTCG